MVTSKGNVAKIKTSEVLASQQRTIPKLELQGLVTLAELFKNLQKNFAHMKVNFTAYTDSQIVLAWVRNNKPTHQKFVDKRIATIRTIIKPENVHYVRSEDNPADPASRGLSAEQLSTSTLWFNGPDFLQNDELPTTSFPEQSTVLVTPSTTLPEDMFERFSNWSRLVRATAYCLRWPSKPRRLGPLTSEDIQEARIRLVKYYQQRHLPEVIVTLEKKTILSKKHWLYRLTPFLDDNGIIRIGGRLDNADHLPESQIHPIVIPSSHYARLLIDYTHKQNGHAGYSLMMQLLTEDYWIAGVRKAIKTCTQRCVTCIRWRAKNIQPQMGQLPRERITPANTFDKTGVDLCGPFAIKASPLRNDRSIKVWVVTFVCLVTKAVHLDIVSSLSSEHFIAAFGRFCSRRGTSSEIWSDNGTNFVGANRLLRETWTKILQSCQNHTSIQEVKWKFIPRHSPTFGGLWEASVKSLKYFVRRMANVTNLTYEEFTTLLCRIESLMNSRPLFSNPLTPYDPPALTPFHFINQRGFKPHATEAGGKVPLTKKWLMIQQIQQQFWTRFQAEYLRELQVKVKWQRPQKNLDVDQVVLIKEPSSTPGHWKMGRIIKTYPDPKGIVRKVDVIEATNKTSNLHAVNQLVPLLPEEQEEPQEVHRTNTRVEPTSTEERIQQAKDESQSLPRRSRRLVSNKEHKKVSPRQPKLKNPISAIQLCLNCDCISWNDVSRIPDLETTKTTCRNERKHEEYCKRSIESAGLGI